MSVSNWMLNTPPRLCQLQIYKRDEGVFGCWATAAEMVVKWKSRYSYFARPSFQSYLDDQTDGSGASYESFILDWFDAWGFESQGRGGFGTWSPQEMATTLRDKGPVVAIGAFGGTAGSSVSLGGQVHAIAVYGYAESFGGIYYIDPWDAASKRMSLSEFRNKLWGSYNAVLARIPNYRA